MNRNFFLTLIVLVVIIVLVAALYVTSSPGSVQQTIPTTAPTTTVAASTSLTPACASTGNCTIRACPSGASYNLSKSTCYWNTTVQLAQQPLQTQTCGSGVCLEAPVLFQSGVWKNVTFQVSDNSAKGSAYLNLTCGDAFKYNAPNTVIAANGIAQINVYMGLPNLGTTPVESSCIAVLHTPSGVLSPGVQFITISNPSCQGGALVTNITTCKAVVPARGGKVCYDGFWYSNSTGTCQPEAVFCNAQYSIDPLTPGFCVLANACPSGYNFTLSSGAPLCSK